MSFEALDTETRLISPGYMAPEMACVTWATEAHEVGIAHACETGEANCRRLLESDATLVALNMPFDAGVIGERYSHLLPAVFEKFEAGLMRDVGLDQRLIDIARGQLDGRHIPNPDFNPALPAKGKNKTTKWVKHRYSVEALADRLLGEKVAKGEDTWRLRYGSLIPVPLAQWPHDAVHYAIKDAVLHMRIHQAHAPEEAEGLLHDSESQAQAAFGLHLMSCRGLRTDEASCWRLIEAAEAEIERCTRLCAGRDPEFDYPYNFEPLLRVQKGKYVKSQVVARDWMRGAILRANGIRDTEHSRAALDTAIRELLEGADDFKEGINTVYLQEAELQLGGLIAADVENADVLGAVEVDVSLTKTGEICLDADACKDVNDPVLRAYATYTSASSMRKKTRRMLLGARMPLQTRFQTLVATGRTSSSSPQGSTVGDNYQNMRRNALVTELKEELPGQRECFIPRPGYVFCSIDLDNAEMRGMAQICLWMVGYSKLAEALNAGQDCHLKLAAGHLFKAGPLDYAEAERRYSLGDKENSEFKEADNARQFAKIPNFALLGGAAAATLIPYAKGMNITLSDERAVELYKAFHAEWTEIAPLHRWVKRQLRDGGGSFVFEHPISRRRRYIDRYTVGCNNPFQGLIADAAKSCALPLAKLAYTVRSSPLYGSFPVLFAHDEYIFELRRDRAHEAAWAAEESMRGSVNRWLPDVSMPKLKPALMDRWYKGAKTYYDPNTGKLAPWQPKKKKVA